MNKEDYLEDRETGRITMEGAYQMYLEKDAKPHKLSFEQFAPMFKTFILRARPYTDEYFKYWDEKFNIKEEENANTNTGENTEERTEDKEDYKST